MSYYESLKEYDKELTIIWQTSSISTKTLKVAERIEELIHIYCDEKGIDYDGLCKGCTARGRALRILAKDYQEMKAKDLGGVTASEFIELTAKVAEINKPKVDYSKFKYQELRNLCKEKNIPLNKKDKRQDLIDKLNNHE